MNTHNNLPEKNIKPNTSAPFSIQLLIKQKRTSPWELMDPRTKNDSDKTQDIRMPFDPF